MRRDIYPVQKIPFEELLIKNNYLLEDDITWKYFVHPIYCIHRCKKGEICRRKKILGKEYCGRHSPRDELLINRCNYNGCKRLTKENKLCYYHQKQFDNICNIPLPNQDIQEIVFLIR